MCSNTPASQSSEAVRRGQRSNGAKNTRGRSLGCPACQNLVAFHQRCGERKSNHFLRRHVRLRKYRSACKRARRSPWADSACAAVRPQNPGQQVILFDSHHTRGRSLGCRDVPAVRWAWSASLRFPARWPAPHTPRRCQGFPQPVPERHTASSRYPFRRFPPPPHTTDGAGWLVLPVTGIIVTIKTRNLNGQKQQSVTK